MAASASDLSLRLVADATADGSVVTVPIVVDGQTVGTVR